MNYPQHVYLGIGTNLGDRLETIQHCIHELHAIGITILRTASIYETTPWNFTAENNFYNTVIECTVQMDPQTLLRATQQIEKKMGRLTKTIGAYASRIIDIDILLYEGRVLITPELTIPHALLSHRNFVLKPLNELIPEASHPLLKKTVSELLDCSNDSESAFIVHSPLSVY
jgi:2-amino-4-hydroxy-6-hydroxymethyldihydropteridine diphosphokinase